MAAGDVPPSVSGAPMIPPMMPAPGSSFVTPGAGDSGVAPAGSISPMPAPIPAPPGVISDVGGTNIAAGSSASDPEQPATQTNIPTTAQRITRHLMLLEALP